jgi:CDP-diacylglycerol pyrophosphatase
MRSQLRAAVAPVTLIVVTMVALAAGMVVAHAQKKSKEELNARTVQGTVVDADDKRVPGAVVQLKDMRTLQVRSFIAQNDGAYHFSGLKPDVDYQLKAVSQGAESGWKTLSVFDDRKTAIINLKLEKK